MFDIIIKLDTHGLEIYTVKGIDKGISDIDITKGKPKIQITGTKVRKYLLPATIYVKKCIFWAVLY